MKKEFEKLLDDIALSILPHFQKKMQEKGWTKLPQTLRHSIEAQGEKWSVFLEMEKYAEYQLKGVRGAISDKYNTNSPFAYKDKKPPLECVLKFCQQRGIGEMKTNKKGETFNAAAYAIREHIYKHGFPAFDFMPELTSEQKQVIQEKFEKFYEKILSDVAV